MAPFHPILTVNGTAKLAKAGTVLLIGEAAYPMYIDGHDEWTDEQLDKLQRVVGRVQKKSYLPIAETYPDGMIAQGVAPGSEQWVLYVESPTKDERAPEALPIALFASAYPRFDDCVAAFSAELIRAGESPDAFVVGSVSAGGNVARFPLWHASAFLPENRHMNGNPGGKSRDAVCILGDAVTVSFEFWQ